MPASAACAFGDVTLNVVFGDPALVASAALPSSDRCRVRALILRTDGLAWTPPNSMTADRRVPLDDDATASAPECAVRCSLRDASALRRVALSALDCCFRVAASFRNVELQNGAAFAHLIADRNQNCGNFSGETAPELPLRPYRSQA